MRIELATASGTIERVRGCCEPVAELLPKVQVENLSALFKALADPARIQILHTLKAASEPVCVCDFTASLDVGQPTISHHLAKLKEAGLIISEKRGIWAFYQLDPQMPTTARVALTLIP